MRTSRSQESFVCVACGTGMERVRDVPVLQSLEGHTVHQCSGCGHILLVQKHPAAWSLGWLNSLEEDGAIACAAFV